MGVGTNYFEASRETPRKAAVVRSMFDRVAPKYDLFNTLLSFGLDRWWRRVAIKTLLADLPEGHTVLDAGCGSGDLGGRIRRRRACLGLDFSLPMLREGQRKFPDLALCQADATRLPLADACLAGVISAFVIRNISDIPRCFSQMYRCMVPGGRFVILEFSLPRNALLRWGFQSYMALAMPVCSRLFAGDPQAYDYLRRSISDFAERVDLVKLLGEAGFRDVVARPLLGGSVQLLSARR